MPSRITNDTSGIATLPPNLGSIVLGPGKAVVTSFSEREIVEAMGGDQEFPRGLSIQDVPDQPGARARAIANDYFPSVLDRDLTAPPAAPATSDRYLVAVGGTGAWAGRDNQIAEWSGRVWLFTIATKGGQTYVEDESAAVVFDGSTWDLANGGPVTDADIPDPYTPPDGTWNVVGLISTRASGGAAGSEQLGEGASATGTRSTAVGANAAATNIDAAAFGENADASSNGGVAVGADAVALGTQSTAVGKSASAQGSTDVALGGFASATGGFGVAVGNSATATQNGAVSVGQGADATGVDAQAMGQDSLASHSESMALGVEAQSTAQGRATFGRVAGSTTQRKDVEASGDLRVVGHALNGQTGLIQTNSSEVSGLSGASTTVPNLIPAGAVLLGLTARVITAITGATSFDIGDGTDVDRWGAGIAIALDTTADNTDWTSGVISGFPAANDVVLTAVGGSFTAGAVRVTAHYFTAVAPTS